MSFKILYVAATDVEAGAPGKTRGIVTIPGGYRSGDSEISVLVAGVGSIATAWAMHKWLSVNEKPDLAINAGIAGSYRQDIVTGNVVLPVSDCFADAGIEDGNKFLTLREAGLAGADDFPFREGVIHAGNRFTDMMRKTLMPVRAITVNTATGSEATRDKLVKKYNPDIETMEGATFFYICSIEKIPFLALRAISNMVELRNKSKWDIPLALSNLSEKLDEVFSGLAEYIRTDHVISASEE